jgi:hypothetical protein
MPPTCASHLRLALEAEGKLGRADDAVAQHDGRSRAAAVSSIDAGPGWKREVGVPVVETVAVRADGGTDALMARDRRPTDRSRLAGAPVPSGVHRMPSALRGCWRVADRILAAVVRNRGDRRQLHRAVSIRFFCIRSFGLALLARGDVRDVPGRLRVV